MFIINKLRYKIYKYIEILFYVFFLNYLELNLRILIQCFRFNNVKCFRYNKLNFKHVTFSFLGKYIKFYTLNLYLPKR